MEYPASLAGELLPLACVAYLPLGLAVFGWLARRDALRLDSPLRWFPWLDAQCGRLVSYLDEQFEDGALGGLLLYLGLVTLAWPCYAIPGFWRLLRRHFLD